MLHLWLLLLPMSHVYLVLSHRELPSDHVSSADYIRLEQKLEKTNRAMMKIFAALTNMIDDENILESETRYLVKTEAVYPVDDLAQTINHLSINDLKELMKGRDGAPGENGVPGRDGSAGQKGNPGLNGAAGLPGTSGDPGERGHPGRDGSPGERGPKGPSGSVYTRWGRKSCPGNSTLIYEGFSAGGAEEVTGGGTNYQCLPLNPDEDSFRPPVLSSIISGSEYFVGAVGPYPSITHNQNVPCARCFKVSSAVMMVPAKNDCPIGWKREYHGYLMSARIDLAHQSTYECMDINPEYVQGQQGWTAGAAFYFVKPDCTGEGTIGHCPPYRADKKLLCAVCSK